MNETSNFDKRFKKLVRQYYSEIPDEDYNVIGFEALVSALGPEKQLQLTIQASSGSDKVEEEEEDNKYVSFENIPLDILAYMLKNTNNNSLRSLCRVESSIRKNCWKLVDKIAQYRHSFKEWDSFTHRHPKKEQQRFEKYPVEALQAFEATKIINDLDMTVNMEFSKHGENVLSMIREPREYLIIYERNRNVFKFDQYKYKRDLFHKSGDPGASTNWLLTMADNIRTEYFLFELLVDDRLTLTSMSAIKDGDEWVDTAHITSKICTSCNSSTAKFSCGDCKIADYCNDVCQ